MKKTARLPKTLSGITRHALQLMDRQLTDIKKMDLELFIANHEANRSKLQPVQVVLQ